MRISDWSSDLCSSDLVVQCSGPGPRVSCRSGFSRELFGSGQEELAAEAAPTKATLVAEVVELQRQLEFLAAQQRHRRLQVVALLAGHAQLVAVDLAVDLELGVLDRGLDLLRQFARDALAHGDLLVRACQVGLDVQELQDAPLDLPRPQPRAQEEGQ